MTVSSGKGQEVTAFHNKKGEQNKDHSLAYTAAFCISALEGVLPAGASNTLARGSRSNEPLVEAISPAHVSTTTKQPHSSSIELTHSRGPDQATTVQLDALEDLVGNLRDEVLAGRSPMLGSHRRMSKLQVDLLEKACQGLRSTATSDTAVSVEDVDHRPMEVTIEYLALSHLLGIMPEDVNLSKLSTDVPNLCTWIGNASNGCFQPSPSCDPSLELRVCVAAVVCSHVPGACMDHFIKYHISQGCSRVMLFFDLAVADDEQWCRDAISRAHESLGVDVTLMTSEWWASERSRNRILIRADAAVSASQDWKEEQECAANFEAGQSDARRLLAIEAMVREAQTSGFDWLVVLEPHELLHCPHGNISAFLAALPGRINCVHFHNFEAMPESLEPLTDRCTDPQQSQSPMGRSWFSECTLFKVNRHFYAEEQDSAFQEWLCDPRCTDPWGAKCALGVIGLRHVSLEKAQLPLVPRRARVANELGLQEDEIQAELKRYLPDGGVLEADMVDQEPSLFPEIVSLFFNGYDSGRSACRLNLMNPPLPDGLSRFHGDGCELEYITADKPTSPVVLSFADIGFKNWQRNLQVETLSALSLNMESDLHRSKAAGRILARREKNTGSHVKTHQIASVSPLERFYRQWYVCSPEEKIYMERCGLTCRIENVRQTLTSHAFYGDPCCLSQPVPRVRQEPSLWLQPAPSWPRKLTRRVVMLWKEIEWRSGPSVTETLLGSCLPGEQICLAACPSIIDSAGAEWMELSDRPGWVQLDEYADRVKVIPEVFDLVD